MNRQVYEFRRTWTIEEAIGYFYSTPLPLRRLLGDRQAAFEDAVTTTLLAIDPRGGFIEPVALEVMTATRNSRPVAVRSAALGMPRDGSWIRPVGIGAEQLMT